jgi:hypothetical protein
MILTHIIMNKDISQNCRELVETNESEIWWWDYEIWLWRMHLRKRKILCVFWSCDERMIFRIFSWCFERFRHHFLCVFFIKYSYLALTRVKSLSYLSFWGLSILLSLSTFACFCLVFATYHFLKVNSALRLSCQNSSSGLTRKWLAQRASRGPAAANMG